MIKEHNAGVAIENAGPTSNEILNTESASGSDPDDASSGSPEIRSRPIRLEFGPGI